MPKCKYHMSEHLNRFSIEGYDEGFLEMDLTPEMADYIPKALDIEIEVLQGTTIELPTGMIRISCTVPPDKALIVKEFILKAISRSNNPVNKN